jgi:predicted nucleic acid-binding protein
MLRQLLPDEPQEHVQALWAEWARTRTELLAPPVFPAEVLSGLWQAVRRSRVTREEAGSLLNAFLDLEIRLASHQELLPSVWSLLERYPYARTYDLHYLALASLTRNPLWTADKQFFDRVSADWPQVNLLGQDTK